MNRTTKVIQAVAPGSSTSEYGHVHLVTLPAAPWEQPVTLAEAIQQAHASGGIIRHAYRRDAEC